MLIFGEPKVKKGEIYVTKNSIENWDVNVGNIVI